MSVGKLDAALSHLIDRDKWTLQDEVTGTTTVTVPNTATEVYIIVACGSSMYTAYLLISSLSKTRLEMGGYYNASNDYGLCNLNISNSNRTFQIRNAKYSGTDYKSSSKMSVYYK